MKIFKKVFCIIIVFIIINLLIQSKVDATTGKFIFYTESGKDDVQANHIASVLTKRFAYDGRPVGNDGYLKWKAKFKIVKINQPIDILENKIGEATYELKAIGEDGKEAGEAVGGEEPEIVSTYKTKFTYKELKDKFACTLEEKQLKENVEWEVRSFYSRYLEWIS